MFIVRYPSGLSITYNDANWLTYTNGNIWELYIKKDGKWIASISPAGGCVVESVPACKVENPMLNLTGENALQFIVDHIQELTNTWKGHNLAKALKKKMAMYSTRSAKWKTEA